MNIAGEDAGLPATCASARALQVRLPQGVTVLDATGGDGRMGAGRDRERIAAARRAAGPGAATVAERNRLRQAVAALMPPLLDDISFAASGAQAIARAIAMVGDYHRRRGQAGRQRIIICAGRPKDDPCPAPFHTADVFVGRALRNVAAQLAALGPECVAAILIEPLGLADEMMPFSAADMQELRLLCERSGVLLISDESVAGLGRTGAAIAAQRLDVIPDLAVMGEVLTNDVAPLGVVVARAEIAGSSAEAEPMAGTVAAAMETLAIYDQEQLFRRSAELELYWKRNIHSLAGAPAIAEIRCLGLAAALVLAPRPGDPGGRGQLLHCYSLDYGVLTRVQKDTVLLTPSLVITRDQIDEIVEKLSAALRKIT